MAVFAIYHYEISREETAPCTLNFSPKPLTMDSPYGLFDSFWGKAGEVITDLNTSDKDGNTIRHNAKVEQHLADFIVFSLQTRKSKKVSSENWKTDTVGHYPFCRILIDNRHGSHILYIERKTEVFPDPDKAVDIIKQSINRKLNEYGFAIKMGRLTRNLSFWDGVNEIRSKFNDHVQRVEFDFRNGDHGKDDGSFTYKMMRWISMFAEGSDMGFDIGDDSRLAKVKEDLNHMAELCATNDGYNLLVKFNHFGIFRYGQDIKAQYGMDDSIIDNFIDIGRTPMQTEMFDEITKETPTETLTKWFDRVIKLYEEYDKEETLAKKRNRGHRA